MRSVRSFLTAAAVAAVLAGPALTPAGAAPAPHVGNPRAACQGTAWSEHGANGSPGEVADEHQFARTLVLELGFRNVGVVNSAWAHADAGTHAECEAAVLTILGLG